MKVSHVLSENGDVMAQINLDFNELTSIHIGALRAIADERLDFDNASDRMLDVVYELQELNLVNQVFELTPTGAKAVRLATTLGGSYEKRKAANRKPVEPENEVDPDDVYDDDYGSDLGYDDDDMSEFNHNRFGSPNQNN